MSRSRWGQHHSSLTGQACHFCPKNLSDKFRLRGSSRAPAMPQKIHHTVRLASFIIKIDTQCSTPHRTKSTTTIWKSHQNHPITIWKSDPMIIRPLTISDHTPLKDLKSAPTSTYIHRHRIIAIKRFSGQQA